MLSDEFKRDIEYYLRKFKSGELGFSYVDWKIRVASASHSPEDMKFREEKVKELWEFDRGTKNLDWVYKGQDRYYDPVVKTEFTSNGIAMIRRSGAIVGHG